MGEYVQFVDDSMVRRMERELTPVLSAVRLMSADISELTGGC